jgi:hypothetical protein
MKAEITIPTSLDEVSLSNYQKLLAVIQQDTEASDFIQQKTLQYICDIPFELVTKISKKDFDAILKEVDTLFSEQPKFIQRFKLHGVEYGFIPNLDKDMTIAEFASLTNYFDDWEQMHKAMAILYRPVTHTIGDKYRIEDFEGSDKYCDVFKDMPISVVLGARFFFRILGIELSNHTLKSLTPESKEGIALRQTLEQSGVGINQFMHSLEEMRHELSKPNY